MPTCVEVGGATYPSKFDGNEIQPMEGCSLIPAFHGRSIGRKDVIYWEHEGNRAVREGKWKLVAKGRTGPWELYDMQTDRTEINNLAAKFPIIVQDLSRSYEAWAKRSNVEQWRK